MSIYKTANYFLHWKFPSSVERLAAITSLGDVGKVALEVSSNTLYMKLAVGWLLINVPASGSLVRYTEVFTSSALWTVNHNLGKEPFIMVLTTGGLEMLADVLHVSINQLTVAFSQPQAGRVQAF